MQQFLISHPDVTMSRGRGGAVSSLISFRIDWFDLLAVQGTHKSLLQTLHKSLSGHSFCHFIGFKGSIQFSKDSMCAFSGSTEARYIGCGLWGHADSGVNLSLSLIDSGETRGPL